MTLKELTDRGYKPFADYKGTIPINGRYYFTSMGSHGYESKDGGYLGIYFHKGNVVVLWSLNYVYPKGAHNPPCFETVYNKRGYYIETAYNRILKRQLEDSKK